MTFPVYSSPIAGGNGAPVNATTVVDPDKVLVIRSVCVLFSGSAVGDLFQAYDHTLQCVIFQLAFAGEKSAQNLETHQVLLPNTTYSLASSGGGTVYFRLSGYILSSP